MQSFGNKFYATFLLDNRYTYFLTGLKNTLLLTFASFLLGAAFGVLLCAAQRSANAALRKIAQVVSYILVEIPTLVMLMVFVYIIFGHSALPVVVIVAIGLTLKAGAYLSAIFRAALDTVNPGELEAARTLGMSRWRAFRYVELPQAARAALPLCKNQFISTMQETSVVGYLAIMDLTRASSVVSSRTMDSLFGLMAVTAAYFIIGAVAKTLMGALVRKGGGVAA